MNRRTLVRLAPGVGLGLLAGCLGAADDSSGVDGNESGNGTDDGAQTHGEDGDSCGNETDANETSTAETEGETAAASETDRDSVLEDDALTFETLETGPFELIATTALDESAAETLDEEAAVYHRIRVENTSTRDRDLSVRIDRDESDGDGETTVLEGTNELPAETALEIVVSEPGTYETTLEAGGIRNSTSISRSGQPCEESRTVVSFTEGGIETNTTTSC